MTDASEHAIEGFSTGEGMPVNVALRRLFRVAPSFARGLGWTILLALASAGLPVAIPVVVQQIVDNEILASGGVDLGGAMVRSSVVLAAMVVAAICRRQATFRLATRTSTGLSDLRVLVMQRLHSMSALHVQAERRGALVARVTSDVFRIQDFMEWGGMGLLLGISQVVLTVAAMLYYSWQLALLVVIGVTLYGLLLFVFQRVLGKAHDRVRVTVSESMAAIGESITGLPVVRAYGAESRTLRRVRQTLDAQSRTEFKTAALGAGLFSSAEVFAGGLMAAVVAAGVWLGPEAGLTAGSLLAFVFLVNLLVDPVQILVETLDEAQAAASGLRRVLGVLDTPVDLVDPGVDGSALSDGPLDVRVSGLRFRYPDGPEVIRGVDVAIPAGRRIAVVGETGSGKTTFAKLVVRLLDAGEGVVEIGGAPITSITFASLRARVAYVPQEGFLFNTTIAENVRYGNLDADTDDIRSAFADLGLTEWLDSLPAGLETEVGERGGQLSAGERQLIALVRAWMAQPDLLVLDEATSAVDPALELALRNAIDLLIEGHTSITVAHRLSTAEASDEILVFDRGELVERGAHSDLVSAGGVYAGLHESWMAGTR